MSAEVVVASVAAMAAVTALYFNWRSTRAAARAARAAEDQTEIQRQIRIDAAQPFVWVDIRPDASTGILLNLVVGNSGSTVATNVRVTADAALPRIEQLAERVAAAEKQLARGISSLPPGRTYTWPLGQGFNLISDDAPQQYTFTVEAEGPFGAVPVLTYVVDLAALKGMMDRPTGSLHELTSAMRDLTKVVDRAEHRANAAACPASDLIFGLRSEDVHGRP
jgi:hypothetical protein